MKKYALLAVFLLVTMVFGASATTVVKMTVDDLTQRSDRIVVGKVSDISYGSNDKNGYPETRVKVSVLETVFGSDDQKEVTVCLPGGPAGDNLVTIVPGVPKFKKDEKTVLFLVSDVERKVVIPTGLEQGVFRVKKDPVTEEEYIVNKTVDLKVSTLNSGQGGKAGNAKKKSGKYSLKSFTDEIKSKASKLRKE